MSVLWCMNIANFIFIAVKKKLKLFEKEEHVQAPESVWVHVGAVSGRFLKGGFLERSPRLPWGVPWGNHCRWLTEPPQGELVTLLWQSFLDY